METGGSDPSPVASCKQLLRLQLHESGSLHDHFVSVSALTALLCGRAPPLSSARSRLAMAPAATPNTTPSWRPLCAAHSLCTPYMHLPAPLLHLCAPIVSAWGDEVASNIKSSLTGEKATSSITIGGQGNGVRGLAKHHCPPSIFLTTLQAAHRAFPGHQEPLGSHHFPRTFMIPQTLHMGCTTPANKCFGDSFVSAWHYQHASSTTILSKTRTLASHIIALTFCFTFCCTLPGSSRRRVASCMPMHHTPRGCCRTNKAQAANPPATWNEKSRFIKCCP
ncbi:hypothetical protein P154DRAFT_574136 [Amniculicola lignicola CBS 123094]|uniref:Uncharacterized protein n=1 Tax=Amniculicola lignicola CBS 123094 TaxID=1392246 RepID=A0A6A5WQT9_9PLEO|nr:hypothetical protein P154DRAFT_574136 [Amniculicola lignicola CBS 123094]